MWRSDRRPTSKEGYEAVPLVESIGASEIRDKPASCLRRISVLLEIPKS